MNLRKLQKIAVGNLSNVRCLIKLDKTFGECCGFERSVGLYDIPENLLNNVVSEVSAININSGEERIYLSISNLKEENVEEITIGKFLKLCKYINGNYYASTKLGIKEGNNNYILWSIDYSDWDKLEQIVKGVSLGREYSSDKLGFIFHNR